ncbi:hypothetical protein KPH14_007132 [Odynerus spinipes]|uniref:Atos-like conserved domain-containing protein n=1 Tax=Odynerus spinipes TaxID=1348599 RepID=A0AAD9RS14_9HYME|nr:hypothetical protein KPH14_007132 [Odynerus spinipes]
MNPDLVDLVDPDDLAKRHFSNDPPCFLSQFARLIAIENRIRCARSYLPLLECRLNWNRDFSDRTRNWKYKGMHCLGAVTGGTPSPNGAGSRGGILSVFRALGVLVCEGRIQGPPRGYKEGPHCAPPMQPFPNNHICEEDNYLCDRYLVLVREITDRTAIGSFLCVEVLLCSDCQCGLAKATSKHPICPVPSLSISPWQQTSELLLEYWCICVVPSKGPETMNFQGLYQAVRSRLHFSQVAAWWSRSNGVDPSYVATRVVPHNEDNLRKFRDSPVEHTFPFAGNGDGNSIKVTVWALPRMEDVPILSCSLHPTKEKKDEESVARALTPTKTIPLVSTSSQNTESLVMPVLVDDRLQTPCNKPGKHHCRCEEEDGSPPSPSIGRSIGERKRRRSLPCGPPDSNSCVTFQTVPLPAVRESSTREQQRDENDRSSSSYPRSSSETLNNRGVGTSKFPAGHKLNRQLDESALRSRNNLNSDNLERCFRTQLSIDERDGNVEKRYKRTLDSSNGGEARSSCESVEEKTRRSEKGCSPGYGKNVNCANTEGKPIERNGIFENLIPFNSSLPWSFVESWNNSGANSKCGFQSLRAPKEGRFNGPSKMYSVACSTPVIDPFKRATPFHESNPGPSTYEAYFKPKQDGFDSLCIVHQSQPKSAISNSLGHANGKELITKNDDDSRNRDIEPSKDLNQMMSRLTFPEERDKAKEEGGILDWFSRVPGRVLGVAPNNGYVENGSKAKASNLKAQDQHSNEIKFKNCNLELSQREFDEVLAVLRARTPSGRKRTPLKTIKRRDRYDKSLEESTLEKQTTKFTTNLDSNEYPANHVDVRNKPCEGCNHRYCKKNEHRLAEKTVVTWDRVYGSKNIYNPVQARQDKLGGNYVNDDSKTVVDKRGISTNPVDCLQTVSNKADVLLGAILRTSKDRKGLSDISNGTRSGQTVVSGTKAENEGSPSSTEPKLDQATRIVVPFEDDKSLPLALNKKFNRFRQLFKKEQERKAPEDNTYQQKCARNSSQQQQQQQRCLNGMNLNFSCNNVIMPSNTAETRNLRESKVKRKIDFSNFKHEERSDTSLDSSTNGAHQNSRIHSTNYKEDQRSNACKEVSSSKWQDQFSRLYSTNQTSKEDYYEEVGDQTIICDKNARHKDHPVPSSVATKNGGTVPVSLQNGFSSSKIRNNNHKAASGFCAEDEETLDKGVPSAIEQERFRRSLENAASMVFHSRTGLPLTSSPAPLRRGSCCFDYDSSLNSVSSKRSALFELNTPPSPGAVSLEETDRETENACEGEEPPRRRSTSRNRPQSHALLGSFEESALNGRLEPVSTVHGFTAELGASGSFCPKHRKLPVTVFFYTLGDNDKVSTPYLAHINLGKKGYQVPRSGTIQVTLLNPLGTVVKMFVVLYDLSDMPPRSHTFLRQRTLRDKTLRYLVHLRFMSGKSGRIYLHTDIRMIICRKSDVDTASDFGSEPPKELRSYIHGPTNPKFSPRC